VLGDLVSSSPRAVDLSMRDLYIIITIIIIILSWASYLPRLSIQPLFSMARSRKRKAPITVNTSTKQATTSSLHTRSVIRRFHSLLKSRHRIEHDANNASRQRKLDAIDAQINQLGGLDAYQRMSKLGQATDRGGGTEKVFISWLKDLGLQPSQPVISKLK
jgi:25S rRNA (adenine(2142)-N(1))-methyltransferase, Bmt2